MKSKQGKLAFLFASYLQEDLRAGFGHHLVMDTMENFIFPNNNWCPAAIFLVYGGISLLIKHNLEAGSSRRGNKSVFATDYQERRVQTLQLGEIKSRWKSLALHWMRIDCFSERRSQCVPVLFELAPEESLSSFSVFY
ncbi:hypothetical protein CEXT_706641 [Caerostris extrusa]|uniref:Uncharacterized protein n=1 Tax=Caerostris extrusa TaxID=172846 RepID=A0AAV4RKS1_CAEEX|nr:hypothetical protein CEXT_706641 [Caerostris extrusa]